MPATANPKPSSSPMTLALMVRIRVLGRPVLSRSGIAFLYNSQSRKDSRNWVSTDFVATGPAADGFCAVAAIAAKSGSVGTGAALDPGFQPGGSARGTQSEYSLDQVPSAMTASRPALSASISAVFSLATAYATKLSKLKVFSTITAGSPALTVPCACCDGATQAAICPVLRLA